MPGTEARTAANVSSQGKGKGKGNPGPAASPRREKTPNAQRVLCGRDIALGGPRALAAFEASLRPTDDRSDSAHAVLGRVSPVVDCVEMRPAESVPTSRRRLYPPSQMVDAVVRRRGVFVRVRIGIDSMFDAAYARAVHLADAGIDLGWNIGDARTGARGMQAAPDERLDRGLCGLEGERVQAMLRRPTRQRRTPEERALIREANRLLGITPA